MSEGPWRDGNRVRLLENGEEYFPRVFGAIARARSEVLVETFILLDDPVGRALQQALVDAARRRLRVELIVDGYGSHDLPQAFVAALAGAGVRVHVFGPRARLLGFRVNIFRRLHRKIVVVDGRVAYVGGLNFASDHLRDGGPAAKHDFAIEVEGPLAAEARDLVERSLERPARWWRRRASRPGARVGRRLQCVTALLAVRDNEDRRDGIERHYREAIRAARREVIIANAYFFPGYRLLRELRDAARRGVDVRLILQGRPDLPWVRWATSNLYDYLLRAGVRILEFRERALHAKVAVIDGEWATVGSSNLDPLSLALNLEANVVVRDRAFARRLRERLMRLMGRGCATVGLLQAPRRTPWRRLLSFLAFHVARRFPRWAGLLPGHRGPARPVAAQPAAAAPEGEPP